eukprot:jgi/Chlat1/1911/Chrsp149S02219
MTTTHSWAAGQALPVEVVSPSAASALLQLEGKGDEAGGGDVKHASLDVRTPEEFAAGHVPGAVNVPVKVKNPDAAPGGGHDSLVDNPNFAGQVEKAFPDKNAGIVVNCQAGRRSAHAAGVLKDLGYTGLKDLQDGLSNWSRSGLPLSKQGDHKQ